MDEALQAAIDGNPVTVSMLERSQIGPLKALAKCPQTPEHHGEGNVAVHTAMAVAETYKQPSIGHWEDVTLRLGALFHDIGKPTTTIKVEKDGVELSGCWSSKGHAEEGARISNTLFDTVPQLQKLPLGVSVGVHTLIRNHMWTYGIEHVSPGAMLRSSHLVNPALLVGLWQADGEGRICTDPEAVRYRYQLAKMHLEENNAYLPDSYSLLEQAATYLDMVSPRVKRETFRSIVDGTLTDLGATHAYVFEREKFGKGGTLTYTMGLPGVGKSTWAAAESLKHDSIFLSTSGTRKRDRVASRRKQLSDAAKLLAEGKHVYVDATNLRRESRDLLLNAAMNTGAIVEGVWFKGTVPLAIKRQDTRPWEDAVPKDVIKRMRRDARFPSPDEYDTLRIVEENGTEWLWDTESRFKQH